MIKVRIEEKLAFQIIGHKTWIGGTDDEAAFGRFWEQCRQDGLLSRLDSIRGGRKPGPITNGFFLGVSRVEKDPSNRSFFFYVGIESEAEPTEVGLEGVLIPASNWAVFQSQGSMPQALVAAEMYAFTEWLPNSCFVHARVPEMEVYPAGDAPQESMPVEFWLPITEKDSA